MDQKTRRSEDLPAHAEPKPGMHAKKTIMRETGYEFKGKNIYLRENSTFTMPNSRRIWYAAYTRSRAEKKVAQHLTELGIDHYLPLITTIRQWSDRKKKVIVPLIRSYIFVHIKPKEHLPVLLVPGVVKIVHICRKPVAIPEWQIRNLKILLGVAVPMTIDFQDLEKGKEVRITHGSMTGLRGKILRVKGKHKLVITINALNYNLTIDINPQFVEPIIKRL